MSSAIVTSKLKQDKFAIETRLTNEEKKVASKKKSKPVSYWQNMMKKKGSRFQSPSRASDCNQESSFQSKLHDNTIHRKVNSHVNLPNNPHKINPNSGERKWSKELVEAESKEQLIRSIKSKSRINIKKNAIINKRTSMVSSNSSIRQMETNKSQPEIVPSKINISNVSSQSEIKLQGKRNWWLRRHSIQAQKWTRMCGWRKAEECILKVFDQNER